MENYNLDQYKQDPAVRAYLEGQRFSSEDINLADKKEKTLSDEEIGIKVAILESEINKKINDFIENILK